MLQVGCGVYPIDYSSLRYKVFVKGPKNPATSILTYENQWPRTALLKSDRSQSGWSKTGG